MHIHSIYLKNSGFIFPFIFDKVYISVYFLNFLILIDFESKLCVSVLLVMPLAAWDYYSTLQFNCNTNRGSDKHKAPLKFVSWPHLFYCDQNFPRKSRTLGCTVHNCLMILLKYVISIMLFRCCAYGKNSCLCGHVLFSLLLQYPVNIAPLHVLINTVPPSASLSFSPVFPLIILYPFPELYSFSPLYPTFSLH